MDERGGVLIPEEFDGYAALPETELRLAKKGGPQFADDNERRSAETLQNFNSRVVKQADVVLLMSLFRRLLGRGQADRVQVL